jgi:hypothetical protein
VRCAKILIRFTAISRKIVKLGNADLVVRGLKTGGFGGPIGSAIGALIGSQVDIFNLGGPKSTLSSTKDEWTKIKSKLDAEAAWPIGLVYSDAASPFAQHGQWRWHRDVNGLG